MTDRAGTVAIVGNPNCGKSTLFNALTGSSQRVGNWPGVTVERKEGRLVLPDGDVKLVDLPGIYALLASSDDERVARDYVLSGAPQLVIDIVDAGNLERNLFLTTQLLDLEVPLLVVVNMLDAATAQGIRIDLEALATGLGCPTVGISAIEPGAGRIVAGAIADALREPASQSVRVGQPVPVEELAAAWAERLAPVAAETGATTRWLALKLIERDDWATSRVLASGAFAADELERELESLEASLGGAADIALAEARYRFIEEVTERCLVRAGEHVSMSDRIDRVVLNRFLGIPLFFLAMYLLFWATVNVGGAFVDFFDLAGGTLLVDGFGRLLTALGSPAWLVTVLADGLGAGLQTTITFIPIVFVMFVGLSLLEDSGYMARAAFVMDRGMRWLGLPGKSFVPMLLGFGCNVPAIMATRTLENRRDRYLTIFVNPFMSCSARLPVYALFGAAFFGAAAGAVTFSLYLVGIGVAILSGLLLKRTLFQGEAAPFVMELPPYHRPRLRTACSQGWRRLLVFLTRAKYIVPVVTLLAVLNAVGGADSSGSLLSRIGRTITPVFEPMGVEEENWPATVGIFTGVLAKESVVSTLNSLYVQEGDAAEATPGVGAGLRQAAASVPAALEQVPATLVDPLGVAVIGGSQGAVADEVGASASVYAGLRAGFTGGGAQAYAYLLFVLLYLPCVATFAAMTREMGLRHTLLAVAFVAVVAWSAATLFYQAVVAHDPLWTVAPVVLLGALALSFWAIGRRRRPATTRALEPVQVAAR